MKTSIPTLAMVALTLFTEWSFAQQQRKYQVDPKTNWAVGAKPTPADELKRQLDAGTVKIIDVRPAASFERETIPGAINVPFGAARKLSTNSSEGYPHCVHVRDGILELAGCEAS